MYRRLFDDYRSRPVQHAEALTILFSIGAIAISSVVSLAV